MDSPFEPSKVCNFCFWPGAAVLDVRQNPEGLALCQACGAAVRPATTQGAYGLSDNLDDVIVASAGHSLLVLGLLDRHIGIMEFLVLRIGVDKGLLVGDSGRWQMPLAQSVRVAASERFAPLRIWFTASRVTGEF
jgi:hypothetical protein